MSFRGTRVNARLLALLLASSALLVAILTLVLWDWVRDAIVTPILFVLWLGGLLIKSTSQGIFWGVFLVTALLILANSLGVRKKPDQSVGEAERGRPRRERVSFWAMHVHRHAHGDSSPMGNAEPLRRLVLEVVAFQERLSLKEAEQRLEAGELDVPPSIRAYLQHGLTPEPSTPISFWEMLGRRWVSLGVWARDRIGGLAQARSRARPSPFDAELESVVRFLEDRLEIKYDD